MTQSTLPTPQLGRYGIWTGQPVTPDIAVQIQRLGYGAIWVGQSPGAALGFVETLLEPTSSLTVATGIVNIWSAPAEEVADSYHRIQAAFPGRFLLGIGAGHGEQTQQYHKPYEALVGYLDELDTRGVPHRHRVLAALGPKVLTLAAQRSAGAHPYLVPPLHTRRARDLMGRSALLAPEQAVALSRDAAQARAMIRQGMARYLSRSNYVNNWKRLGFTDSDVAAPGSDTPIDSLVAHGGAEDIAEWLNEAPAGRRGSRGDPRPGRPEAPAVDVHRAGRPSAATPT